MDNAIYVNLSRQTALLREMSAIATNVANMNTEGYRREASIFSEYIKSVDGPAGSLSMTSNRARFADPAQGVLDRTGGAFDFAIEGDGYFSVDTPGGQRLTRSGAFTVNPENQLVTADGYPVLNPGGAPVFMPPNAATIAVATDGSISVDGQLIDQLGIVTVADPMSLRRTGGTLLEATGAVQPAEEARVAQGYLESSNVNAVEEITRMIDVQRSYELGQNLMEKEHERIRQAVQTLGRAR